MWLWPLLLLLLGLCVEGRSPARERVRRLCWAGGGAAGWVGIKLVSAGLGGTCSCCGRLAAEGGAEWAALGVGGMRLVEVVEVVEVVGQS
ncbi:hypothetical protein V8C86DRAFT_2522259 [Haematococcus lacustris]